ncbi:MAG: host-nuclease inhibitor Gam family protein [Deltaproteobacteria bacterium]|nr:host-nuclease inhibitor Gam family protein [Deltaproteobacteria bacterium]MBW2081662.1 host-nuclease inhibitor Gam family protein [Deltaproteobacteria bacterium]MBW2298857.1 host-nuclease inhibitor Gam family protein [Deltaproteobacteria bacterium]
MTPRKKADAILWDLINFKVSLQMVQEDAEAELARVREKYHEEISNLEALIESGEKELKALAKKERVELFQGEDKAILPHGVLLFTKQKKVQIPRDALGKIKEQGWLEGIKVVEQINRPIIEKWPDEKLAVIGARKKLVEQFNYELKT